MKPDTMGRVSGLPLLIGDESLEQDVETVICAEPGQTCCVNLYVAQFHGYGWRTVEDRRA